MLTSTEDSINNDEGMRSALTVLVKCLLKDHLRVDNAEYDGHVGDLVEYAHLIANGFVSFPFPTFVVKGFADEIITIIIFLPPTTVKSRTRLVPWRRLRQRLES